MRPIIFGLRLSETRDTEIRAVIWLALSTLKFERRGELLSLWHFSGIISVLIRLPARADALSVVEESASASAFTSGLEKPYIN